MIKECQLEASRDASSRQKTRGTAGGDRAKYA